MKLEQLHENYPPTLGELVGQQIPVTVQDQKMFLKFTKNKPSGINVFVTTGEAGRKNMRRVAAGRSETRTLEDTVALINNVMKETGRPQIELGH